MGRTRPTALPQVHIESFRNQLVFHDRFYVVKHDDGAVRFAACSGRPSTKDIVLCGELDDGHVRKAFTDWFAL